MEKKQGKNLAVIYGHVVAFIYKYLGQWLYSSVTQSRGEGDRRVCVCAVSVIFVIVIVIASSF